MSAIRLAGLGALGAALGSSAAQELWWPVLRVLPAVLTGLFAALVLYDDYTRGHVAEVTDAVRRAASEAAEAAKQTSSGASKGKPTTASQQVATGSGAALIVPTCARWLLFAAAVARRVDPRAALLAAETVSLLGTALAWLAWTEGVLFAEYGAVALAAAAAAGLAAVEVLDWFGGGLRWPGYVSSYAVAAAQARGERAGSRIDTLRSLLAAQPMARVAVIALAGALAHAAVARSVLKVVETVAAAKTAARAALWIPRRPGMLVALLFVVGPSAYGLRVTKKAARR